MKYIKKILGKRYAPKWLILYIDMMATIFSVIVAYGLVENFRPFVDVNLPNLLFTLTIFLVIRFTLFMVFKTYSSVVRYTSTQDAKNILFSISSGTVILLAYSIISFNSTSAYIDRLPISMIIIEYFISTFLIAGYRVGIKMLYSELKNNSNEKETMLIFGAGELGLITKRTIDHDKDNNKKVIGFMDDNPAKYGKLIEGVKIYNLEKDLRELINKVRIDELIISVQDISRKRKEEVVDMCLRYKIKVKLIPSAIDWMNGELSAKQIADVRIEDLLERMPIRLDQEKISSQINNKTILVTGASGSIGSELVRQIVQFYPKEIILIDQAETPLYELELELKEKSNYIEFKFLVADVRNRGKMETILNQYRPQIIYHAAAYKHVPLMEDNPSEAINTNVMGTKNMADLAVRFHVEKFIFVSTDKAVNPTNVMGASKRAAEIYVQSFNQDLQKNGHNHTKFITTRFGNVLGSNGSVIPRFRKQIENGGPVTVTHPEICRYFMTIPEACQLILEAGMIGNGGEIFVFDMGEPVKIVDLAKKMIILSGMKPGKDINIVFTGLRPGEKIMEELLNNKEKTLPTHHSKIMIGKVREYPFEMISREIDDLISTLSLNNDKILVGKIKDLIPEYISNNSRFEELDKLTIHPEIEIN
ncbi:MAG: nucleoside-diphosphate sugar epimerase/dehydratase [Bacteroidota bacterium]|nr:nucleoside-diphosphate sugar epimerase/dehydratase [Bacteroidota bacterium]